MLAAKQKVEIIDAAIGIFFGKLFKAAIRAALIFTVSMVLLMTLIDLIA